jgi:hypothetical protein
VKSVQLYGVQIEEHESRERKMKEPPHKKLCMLFKGESKGKVQEQFGFSGNEGMSAAPELVSDKPLHTDHFLHLLSCFSAASASRGLFVN